MADTTKNIKIVLTADGSQLEVGMKAVVQNVQQQLSKLDSIKEVTNTITKAEAERVKLYADLITKIDRISAAKLPEKLALNAAVTTVNAYNKALDQLESKLKFASSLGIGAGTTTREAVRPTAVANYGTGAIGPTFEEIAAQSLAKTKLLQDKQEAQTRAFLNRLLRDEQEYTKNYLAEEEKRNRSFAQKITDTGIYKPKSDYSIAMIKGMNDAAKQVIPTLEKQVEAETKVINTHKSLFTHIGEVIGIYRLYNAALNVTEQALLSVPKSLIELQTATASLTASFGSFAGATRELAFLNEEAVRTGISIQTLRDSYANASASFIAAGQSAKATREIFANINTVSTTLHLNSDKTYSIYLALSQIFNKTKLQAEELTKQLAQTIPGVTNQQAKALGITVSDLYDRMKKGSISANESVIALSRTLAETYGGDAFIRASQGLNAELGRLSTSWTHFAESIGKASETSMKSFVKTAADLVDGLTKITSNTEGTATALNALASALVALTAGAVIAGLAKIRIGLEAIALVVTKNPWMLGATLFAGLATNLYLSKQHTDELNKSLDATIDREKRLQENKIAGVSVDFVNDPKQNEAVKQAEDAIKQMDKRIQTALNKGLESGEYQKLLEQRKYLIAASARAYADALSEPEAQPVPPEVKKPNKSEISQAYHSALEEAKNAYNEIRADVAEALGNIDTMYKDSTMTVKDYFLEKRELIKTDAAVQRQMVEAERALAAAQADKVKVAKLDGELIKINRTELNNLTKATQEQTQAERVYAAKLAELDMLYATTFGHAAQSMAIADAAEQKFLATHGQYIMALSLAAEKGNESAKAELARVYALKDAAVGDAQANELLMRRQEIMTDYNYAVDRANNLLQANSISQMEAWKQMDEAYGRAKEALQGVDTEAQAILNDPSSKVSDKIKKDLDKAKDHLDSFAAQGTVTMNKFKEVFSGAFTNSFESFITGTADAKKAFQSLVVSILQGIAKIIAQEMSSMILRSLFSTALSGFSATGLLGSGFAGAVNGTNISTNPSFIGPMRPSANGNVFSGPGISAYSGQIVDKPTFFATGGNVMGEAGPEAILPLKRNSQGKLGVIAGGAQGGIVQNSGNQYHVTVNIEGGKDQNPSDMGGKIGEAIIRSLAKEEIYKAQRAGNILNRTTKYS